MMVAGAHHPPVQNESQRHGISLIIRRVVAQFAADVRITLTWMHLAVPVAIGLILWGILDRPTEFRSVEEVLVRLELLLPMLAGLFVSETITRDWTDGTAEWRITQPGGPIRLLLIRMLTSLMLWALIAAGFLGLLQEFYLGPAGLAVSWKDAAILLAPPALFFTGISVVVALVGRASLSGFLATAGYWALAWMSRGMYTGPLHVLYRMAPLEHVSYETTRWWLVAGGTLLLALGGVILAKSERWIR